MEIRGIIKYVDRVGRVLIPANMRLQHGLNVQTNTANGTKVEVLNTDQGILIRPVVQS